MLDTTDKNIINALSRNARVSNVRLARQLGIAVSTVARRTEALLEEHVISIKALPNPYKMGYKASAVIGIDCDLNRVDEACSKLTENGHLTLVVTTFGRFDVLMIADYADSMLLNHFIKQELPQIPGVLAVEPYFVSETYKRYSGMFKNRESSETNILLDENNLQLIEALNKNGRISYSQLAEDLGISVATVSRRVAFLVKEEVIKITVVPNPAKFGYLAIAGVVLHADYTRVDAIVASLAESKEAQVVMKLSNSFDVFLILQIPDPVQLYRYLKEKIAKIEGVLNIETFVISEIVKLSTTATGLKLD